jgi:hypothetical protein
MFKTLETAMCLIKQGRKVLIGSPLKETSRFIANALKEKGVDAIHVLNETTGQTQGKDARAALIYDFQTNDVDALCTGIQAVRLGHNLDAANAVILHGLPDDFESLDQFIARVHRLTSQTAVDVYAVIPRDTLTAKKWELLKSKGDSAAIALDGRLIEHQEEKIEWSEVIREMVERGVKVAEDDIEEADVEDAWEKVAQLADFEIPKAFVTSQAEKQAELKAEAAKLAEAANAQWTNFSEGMLDLLAVANQAITEGVEAMFRSYDEFVTEKKMAVLLTEDDLAALAWWMEHDPEAYTDAEEMFPTDRARLARAAYTQATNEPQPEPEVVVTRLSDEDALMNAEQAANADALFEPRLTFDAEGTPTLIEPVDLIEEEPIATDDDDAVKDGDEGLPTSETDPTKVVQAIKDLKELHELGVLDDDEFKTAKADLLASLKPTKKPSPSVVKSAATEPEPAQLQLV